MKEVLKLLSSSIYFSPERRYVLLWSISLDTQIGIKDTGIKFICPEDNCLWLNVMTSKWTVSCLLHFLCSFHYVVISLVVYCTDEAMKAETRIQVIKSYYVAVVFLAQLKYEDIRRPSEEWFNTCNLRLLASTQKHSATGICIQNCKLGVRVQLLKFCSAHKDERNPQIIFFFHLLRARKTVCVPRTLCAILMDMQIGNKDTGIELICPEDNCLWLTFLTS